MAAADILNADLSTVAAEIRRGFAWWTAELAGLVPERWRTARGAGAATLARVSPAGVVSAVRGGAAVALDPARPVKAVVALEPGQVLVRDIETPRLPPRDSRALVALDLERLAPLRADSVWFDLQLLPGEGARLRPARLALVRREAAIAALDRAADAGVDPVALGVAGPGGVTFDFLPGIRAAIAPPPWWARAGSWWTIAAVLAVMNIGLAVARDRADTERLAALVDAQSQSVALAARLKGRVVKETARREALVREREVREPLAMIAALARAVPPPAWAQRLQWDGRRIALDGFAPGGVDPVAAVRRDAAFRDVRAVGGDLQPVASDVPSFELSAGWVGPR